MFSLTKIFRGALTVPASAPKICLTPQIHPPLPSLLPPHMTPTVCNLIARPNSVLVRYVFVCMTNPKLFEVPTHVRRMRIVLLSPGGIKFQTGRLPGI
jgi:hypothetical protein